MNDLSTTNDPKLIDATVAIVAAALSGATAEISTDTMQTLITSTYNTLSALGQPAAEEIAAPTKREPVVSVRSSIKPDFLVCLIDGKQVKMLKRYLMTNYGMTPDDYRREFNLAKDYPMVAPNYSEKRRELAKNIGLGHKGRGGRKAAAPAAKAATPAKRGRKARTTAPAQAEAVSA